jgi:hypothetical protein
VVVRSQSVGLFLSSGQIVTIQYPPTTRMIVYRDLLSEDEVLSDAFPLKQAVDSEGVAVSALATLVV